MTRTRSWASFTLALLLACGGDDAPTSEACRGPADCAEGTRCINGVCRADPGPTEDAGADAGRDSAVDAAPADAGGDLDAAPDAPSADIGPPDAGPCGPPQDVATLEELVALAPASFGAPASREWLSEEASTPDLVAAATLTVLPSDFEVPADCGGCAIALVVDPELAGASEVSGGVRVERGTAFRLRFASDPGAFPAPKAIVRFQRPCSAMCASGESRCDEDQACYADGPAYCLACDHIASHRCACVDRPEGASCSYSDGARLRFGTCERGRCAEMGPVPL